MNTMQTMPTFNKIFDLPEKEKNIYLRYHTLKWDIEYWEQYVYSYKNNEIQGTSEEIAKDLKECKSKLNKSKNRLRHHVKKYAEYFI